MKRREKLKQIELINSEVDDKDSEDDDEMESSEENIQDFNPVLNFNNKDKSEEDSVELLINKDVNDIFEIPGFKGNEMDFINEKKITVIEDAPQTIEHSLPGWNSWAGEGIEFKKTKFNTVIEKKDGIRPSDREDYTKNHIIINEHIEVNDKYKAVRPYGYTGKDYNKKITTTISLETTSLRIFNRFVKINNNKDKHIPGQSIPPKEFDPQY
ncbi:U3 small nucleolar RNA-associated protein 14 homolog A-like [Arctopsyche grandis]|uniref:U3 small nucleolar RNA-associated protein 14 homolog A-like n=1 Tax=Arctopsyche grandis TaxID=121162 RepID=UPI00406D9F42